MEGKRKWSDSVYDRFESCLEHSTYLRQENIRLLAVLKQKDNLLQNYEAQMSGMKRFLDQAVLENGEFSCTNADLQKQNADLTFQ